MSYNILQTENLQTQNKQQSADQTLLDDHSLLHFITCGSVDDGKSTLIGRLLYDTGAIRDDHLELLHHDSKKNQQETGHELDFSLLVDGLAAEREQGITIDVAYRYFSGNRRFYIIADTPGHEQYTRNMATGASQADLAIILIDARKGVLPQTKRHSFITSMVGIRSIIVAINKMDLVQFDQTIFDNIVSEYQSLLPKLDFHHVTFIPISARFGMNIVNSAPSMPWYQGPTLLNYLETAQIVRHNIAAGHFRLPVQWINRAHSDFRGICGTIASGTVRIGDSVISLPSGAQSSIQKIYNSSHEVTSAQTGDAVVLTLEDEIDTSRGDVLTSIHDPIKPSKAALSQLLWMSKESMVTGKRYLIKLSGALSPIIVKQLEEKIDIHSYQSESATTLHMNEIGRVLLHFEQPLIATTYSDNRTLGAFILIDTINNETVALGTILNLFMDSTIHLPATTNPQIHQIKKIWLGEPFQSKLKFLLIRVIYSLLLFFIAFLVTSSLIGAFSIAIINFFLHPLVELLLHSPWTQTKQFREKKSQEEHQSLYKEDPHI